MNKQDRRFTSDSDALEGNNSAYFTDHATYVADAAEVAANAYTDSKVGNVPFPSSKTSNGWVDLPGGIIMQWGLYYSDNDSAQKFYFPKPFPSFAATVQLQIADDNSKYALSLDDPEDGALTKTYFTVQRDGAIDNIKPFYWFALGW